MKISIARKIEPMRIEWLALVGIRTCYPAHVLICEGKFDCGL